jgi:hypothetical protein
MSTTYGLAWGRENAEITIILSWLWIMIHKLDAQMFQ